MKIFGQLEKAQVENLVATPAAGYPGRIIFNTTTSKAMIDNGLLFKELGGGGGGTSLTWNTDNGTPYEIDNGAPVFLFAKLTDLDGAQVNKAFFKVPESYSAGTQIRLYLHRYSTDITNTVLLAANTYLVRSGTDAMDSVANVHPSANIATALPGTAKIPQKISIPLTDTDGKVNAISVAAGDLLRIELSRGTDTSTIECRVLTSTEVTL